MNVVESTPTNDILAQLKSLIDVEASVIKVVKNPQDLIRSIEALSKLIEMNEIKEAICRQIKLMIVLAHSKSAGSKKFESNKMHALVSGPPGVGKTTIAKIIARIWDSMGVLDEIVVEDKLTDTVVLDQTPPPITYTYNCEISNEVGDIITFSSSIRKLVARIISESGENSELDSILDQCKSIGDTCLSLIDLCQPRLDSPKSSGHDLSFLSLCEQDMPEQRPYVIAGRETFVGEYQGHSAPKTLKFLMENRGKVIIVEEAYLLYTGDGDSFGMEALTVINRFMDEHPGDAVFIFNGYAELLNRTIFSAQPGLKRRFQWCFNIGSYTPAGIAEIFKMQMSKIGCWSLSSDDLTPFFTKNFDDFPAFGGDTERLAFHCKMMYGEKEFQNIYECAMSGCSVSSTFVVDGKCLEQAFIEYIKNRTEPDIESDADAFYRIRRAGPPFGMFT